MYVNSRIRLVPHSGGCCYALPCNLLVNKFTSGNKRSRLVWLTGSALLLLAGSTSPVSANVTIVKEDFTDSTAYGWTVGGTGARCLILTMGRRESLVG
jgi:hypothetical protein